MSEKWMWNGAPVGITSSTCSRAAAKLSTSTYAPSLVACRCAKSSTGRTQGTRDAISTQSSSEPRSRTRPITSTPNSTARSLPSRRSRSVPSCSTTASRAASRGRPLATAGLEMAHEAEQRGVDGEGDVVLAGDRAEPLSPRVVHPEATLEVDLDGRTASFDDPLYGRLRRRLVGYASRAEAEPSHAAHASSSDSSDGGTVRGQRS